MAERAPAGLGNAGRALWRQILGDLPDEWELDAREQRVLRDAARQADDLAALEAAIRKHGVTTRTGKGEVRVSPLVVEARMARTSLAKLLGGLALPDDAGEGRTAASVRAARAANVRWIGGEAAGGAS